MGQGPRHLAGKPRVRARLTCTTEPALLKGLIFGPTGCAVSQNFTRKGIRLYRYYISQSVLKLGPETCPVRRVGAAEIQTGIEQVRAFLLAISMSRFIAERGLLVVPATGKRQSKSMNVPGFGKLRL